MVISSTHVIDIIVWFTISKALVAYGMDSLLQIKIFPN